MSTTVNKDLELTQNIFKSLIWDTLIKAALEFVFSAVPFLRFFLFKFIIESVVVGIGDRIFSAVVLFIDVQYIQLKNAQQHAVFKRDSLNLRLLAKRVGVDSDEFIKAREVAAIAQRDFTRINQ